MTAFDAVVAVIVVLAAWTGWRLGFARVVFPLAAAGTVLWLSARYADRLIVAHTSPAEVVRRGWLTFAAFVAAPLLAATLVSAVIGALDPFRRRASRPGRVCGAAAAVAVLAALVWILAPMSRRQEAFVSVSRGSLTARILDDLPSPPVDVDDWIARGVLPAGLDGLLGTPPPADPPAGMPPISAEALGTVRAATVQVFAERCDQEWTGSGFVVAPGTLVTNAHVVSGATQVDLVSSDGREMATEVVLYDPARDLALLRAPDLDAAPLPIADTPAAVGDVLVTAGHPRSDTALHVAPARVDGFGFVTLDLPPVGLARREVYTLASGDVAAGSSGGPLVDTAGRVVGVVFAGDDSGAALAFGVDEIRGELADHGEVPVSTGSC
jgi:S1-C subfamily serine protease